MHRSFRGLRPLDPHQGLCPWIPPGPLSGPLDPTPQGSRALCASIFSTLRKRFLINGAPSHPLPTGTLEQSYATGWLVNPPIAKLDLFKSLDCRWICKTYAEYCYRNLVTVRRLVQSPTLQSTIFCGVHSDLRGKGIRVSPAWHEGQSISS